MIRIEPLPDGGARVHSETRQPLVYLDQWALYKFANEEPLRTRLLKVFETMGTLMFSYMNAAEIATLEGDSRKKMAALLDGIGINWFPLDANSDNVMRRENEGRKMDSPFDEEFLRGFYPHIHGQGVLSLSKLVELTAQYIPGSKAFLEKHKTEMLAFIAEKKAEVKNQPELAKKFATVPFESERPTHHVYIEVMRPLVTDPGFNPSKNDMVDVVHAMVAPAYSDVILLDNKWAAIARKLQLPPNRLRVYSPNEVEQFLHFMETAKPSW